MGTEARGRRYVFQPNRVESLERREVPSASSVPVSLRNLSATVVGSAHPTPFRVSGPGDREVDFSASGKDKAGHPIQLSGSLITYDPTSYSYLAGTHGSATLTTQNATYHFDVNGPKSDLNATSGISNLKFSIVKSSQLSTLSGTIMKRTIISVGAIQIQRQGAADGSEQVTATIVANAPWKVRGQRT